MAFLQTLRRRFHRCDTPDPDLFAVNGRRWRCPDPYCGATWELGEWHEEDIVAVDSASNVDIGHDVRGWRGV